MRLRITDNSAKGDADLDRLQELIRTVALPRALNALLGPVQSAGFKQIAAVYQIAPRTMEQYASQQLASAADLSASITVKGKGFPLAVFKPVQVADGVRVTVKGRTFVVPHAFMVAKFGLHVFARGSYGGKYGGTPTGQSFGSFTFTKQRLPIGELYSFGPPTAFSNDTVTRAMDDTMQERAGKALERELGAIARGF